MMIIYKQGQQLPYKYVNLELNLTTSFYSFKYFTAAQILKEYPHMPGIQSENTLNTFDVVYLMNILIPCSHPPSPHTTINWSIDK